MAWARIDDSILDHPKILEAGEDARDLLIASIIWCNRHLTDGRIPKAALPVLSQKKTVKKNAEALVRVGLWEDHGSYWQVHDYLDWNPSREEVEKQRAASAERMRKSRARRRGDRATNATVAAQHTRNSAATNSASYGGVAAPTPLHLTPIDPPQPPLAAAGGEGGEAPDEEPEPLRNGVHAIAARVLWRINELTGTLYPPSIELERRIREGVAETDLLAVVNHQWQRDFFRAKPEAFKPSTLFGRRFAEYLAQAKAPPRPTRRPPEEDGYRTVTLEDLQ